MWTVVNKHLSDLDSKRYAHASKHERTANTSTARVKRDRVMEVILMDTSLVARVPSPDEPMADKTFWVAAYQLLGKSMVDCNKDRGWNNATAQNHAAQHRELVRQQMLIFCESAWKIGQKVRVNTLGRLLHSAPIAMQILEAAMKNETYNGEFVTKTQQMVAQKWLDQLEKFTNKEADVFTPPAIEIKVKPLTKEETSIEEYAAEIKLDRAMNAETN